MTRPLAVDLYCGLGGWTEGLLAEGLNVRGYDIEAHEYGEDRYPAELVLRNVLEMHGSEIADADLIVASPPCTEYSYMAMPWSRAKQIARALRGEDEFPEPYRGSRTIADLNALFDACFRLQREASAAAGRHIPMIVENVRGRFRGLVARRGTMVPITFGATCRRSCLLRSRARSSTPTGRRMGQEAGSQSPTPLTAA
jgi:hypothetical protein